jgi:hypothetical protein
MCEYKQRLKVADFLILSIFCELRAKHGSNFEYRRSLEAIVFSKNTGA